MEVLVDLLLFQPQHHGKWQISFLLGHLNKNCDRVLNFSVDHGRGTRGSNCQPLAANLTCTNGPSKQKPDSVSNILAFSSAVAGTAQSSITRGDSGKRQSLVEEGHNINAKDKRETPRPVKQHSGLDSRDSVPEKTTAIDGALSVNLGSQFSCPTISKDNNRGISMPANISDSTDLDGQSSSSSGHENELMFTSEDGDLNLCSEMSSLCIDRNNVDEESGVTTRTSAFSDHSIKSPSSQGLQHFYNEQSREPPTIAQQAVKSSTDVYGLREQSDWISGPQMQVIPSTSTELEEDIISFDNQRLKDPEVLSRPTYLPHSTNSLHSPNHLYSASQQHEARAAVNSNADCLFVDNKHRDSLFGCSSSTSLTSNGYHNNLASGCVGSDRTSEHSFLHLNEDTGKHSGRFLGEADDAEINSIVDKGESSIISNILSLDFDSWDESLRSPQNLAKLLGDDEKQSGSHRIPSSWKPPPNNQSRFSFARQEESVNQALDVQPSHSLIGQLSNTRPFSHEFSNNRDLYFEKLGFGNGFASSGFEESENFASNHSAFSSNKLSGAYYLSFVYRLIFLLHFCMCYWFVRQYF